MPIYEYQCSKCGRLELFQRITENPIVRCPTCQRKVTKLISQSSFHLKGSGWYATDYARKGSSDTSKAKGSSTAESGDGGSSPTKDSGGSSTREAESTSPGSGKTGKVGKTSGAGSAAA